MFLFFHLGPWAFAVENNPVETNVDDGTPSPSTEEVLSIYNCKYLKEITCRQTEQKACPFKCIADIDCEFKSGWKSVTPFSSLYAISYKDIPCCVNKKECPKDPKDCLLKFEREGERQRREEKDYKEKAALLLWNQIIPPIHPKAEECVECLCL